MHYQQGYQLAKAASDQSNDLRSIGLSYLQLGHIYSHEQNYDRATAYYDDAIRLYNDIGLFAFLYEAHKGRLLCYILQGNDPLAKDELQTVLSLFEEHRSKI